MQPLRDERFSWQADEPRTAAPDAAAEGQAAASQLWSAALAALQGQVTRPIYETYLRETAGVRLSGDTLAVAAPSDFITEWLNRKLRPVVLRTLAELAGRSLDVTFEVTGVRFAAPAGPPEPATPAPRPPAEQATGAASTYVPPRLNERYTFETFVEGDNNRLAFAACQAAAERPGERYNPIFIYGGVGLGKTHLLHAMGHALLARGMRVIYVTSEQFTNDFVRMIREGASEEFRARYRSADLLLIDDIQFIAGKEGTMEEFFHTFNDLHAHGRQIVLTSDQPPKKVTGLEDRLISRFEWGLIADIQPPSAEMRLAILQRKARALGRHVPEEVLAFIADRIRDNVRELEGSLNRVHAYAELLDAPITLELAQKALGELPAAPRRRPPLPEEVLETVALYYQVRPAQLAGKGREQRVAHARQVAMYLLREDAGLALVEIGRILGKRDHTTVLYGCKKVEEQRLLDAELRAQLADIRAALARAAS
jgi:chromosomal replication initiator protein